MLIEPTITLVPSGFVGNTWLDTQIVLNETKTGMQRRNVRRDVGMLGGMWEC